MSVRFKIRRVYLDSNGYARHSREYYGLGWPVYAFEALDGSRFGSCRARSLAEAKEHVRRDTLEAVFVR